MTREERNAYNRRHRMVERHRGGAKTHPCAHCANRGVAKRAHDWATIHGRDGLKPEDYVPLCKKCHNAYDGYGHHMPHSEETKALLSRKNRGYVHTPEAVEKIREAARNPSAEARAKMAAGGRKGVAARGGQPMPDEQRSKISATLKAAPSRPAGNPDLGQTRAAQQRAKTHCPAGHEYTPDNIYWRGPPDNRKRQCKTCTRARSAARAAAKRKGT